MNQTISSRGRALPYLLRVLHLVGIGLWLGTLVFFPFCVALPVISGMQALATRPDNWLHLQSEKEGIRLAGEFLDIVFARYFLFQLGCGLAALIPAVTWLRQSGKVHQFRVGFLVSALVLVSANEWWLAENVRYWRHARYASHSAAGHATAPATTASTTAPAPPHPDAEHAFQFWHTLSLAADIVTLLLVFVTVLLAPLTPTG